MGNTVTSCKYTTNFNYEQFFLKYFVYFLQKIKTGHPHYECPVQFFLNMLLKNQQPIKPSPQRSSTPQSPQFPPEYSPSN